MRTRLLVLATLLTLSIACVGPAEAKDLRGRLAFGFNNQLSPVTSASIKYTLPAKQAAVNIQMQVIAGLAIYNARTINDQFFAGFRMLFPIIAEDNLNVYVGGGGGYAGFQDASRAIRLQPVAGVEFFFFGIENLGFSTEFGVNVDIGLSPTVGVDVSTSAGSYAAVGIHYYF